MKLGTKSLCFVVLWLFTPLMGFDDKFYDVNSMPNAFHIIRSRDASQVVYKINLLSNGSLNQEDPILAFWYRYSEDGRIEPITWIQRQLSYGLVFSNTTHDKADFHFAAYDRQIFLLRKETGVFKVYALKNGRSLELDHIYVHFNGGTDWLPTVEYVKMFSTDTATKQKLIHTIKP